MQSKEIRDRFLKFFEERGHRIVDSSSLVPGGDGSLLFTNAGMNQFKDVFTGANKRDYSRATTTQKCVRAGGKHNDLENVGVTARHHTFFEMLGNFSFGDYFKKDAIDFAWDFLTKEMKLDASKLWITVHDSDDEAEELWYKVEGVLPGRVIRMGDKDNFWAMGDTGPCGPCSEIHYDQGEACGCSSPECGIECECDRFLEIWNLVFMQYEQKADGSREPLPRPSIDTGMGIERLLSVVNGKTSNYDTDLFLPLSAKVAEISGKAYERGAGGVSHRVLADHAKASAFLISDGIYPSNEGRGYVLRRIMRRALRHAWMLGVREPILAVLLDVVIQIYKEAYPQLMESRDKVERILRDEEKRFLSTIDQGITMIEKKLPDWQKEGKVGGADSFKLYDTYGFPPDLTRLMVNEKGLDVDMEAFEVCMEEQRNRAREASMFKTGMLEGLKWTNCSDGEQVFDGYEKTEAESKLLRYARTAEGRLLLVPQNCVFYGEAGGQIGDVGTVMVDGNECAVTDTQIVEGLRTLILEAEFQGEVNAETVLLQKVDTDARRKIRANHTCTHLMHKALREVLGEHVEQRGSWVGPSRLRFDFVQPSAVSANDLREVERRVNRAIRRANSVSTKLMPIEEAKKAGAMALFGEKYGDTVRVVNAGDGSVELCGGTHLTNTGEAALFVILSEASVSAGIRRIEAVAGDAALDLVMRDREYALQASAELQARTEELPGRVVGLRDELQGLRKEIAGLRQKNVIASLNEKLANPPIAGAYPYAAEVFEDADANDLKKSMEELRQRYPDLPMFFVAKSDDKVALLLAFPKAWVKSGKANAGKLIKEIAKHVKGGGGGGPDFAQAGGKDPAGLQKALNEFKSFLENLPVE